MGTDRDRLEARLAELSRQDRRIEDHLRAPLDADAIEQAADVQADEVVTALAERTRAEIAELRLALQRMDAGTWGTCDACGEPIPAARLEAMPGASTCVDCA